MQELFCGFYETTSTTSEELFKIVKDVPVLSKFQLPIDKCRSQSYDDAANVSGCVNGLRMKLIHEQSEANFSKSLFQTRSRDLQCKTVFFRQSPHRTQSVTPMAQDVYHQRWHEPSAYL